MSDETEHGDETGGPDGDGWPEFDPTDPTVLAEHARDLREGR